MPRNPGAVLSPGSNAPLALIVSLEGPVLKEAERRLFEEAEPLGFILFKRNIENPGQLAALTQDLSGLFARDVPILIDQEGGRVQRMGPPDWPAYPAMRDVVGDAQALKDVALAIARDLAESGVCVNCAPVLDVLTAQTSEAIGDRAFSDDSDIVAACGKIVCEAFLACGITPVLKHMPGHGRAETDSHKTLPHVGAAAVDLQRDFAPFRAMMDAPYADRLWGMVAHVVYEALDPDYPSSASARVIDAIRDEIGFDGLLLSDDLDMDALGALGDIPQRAKAVLEAGCDIALYCHGDRQVMERLAGTVPPMRADSLERYERSRIRRRSAA